MLDTFASRLKKKMMKELKNKDIECGSNSTSSGLHSEFSSGSDRMESPDIGDKEDDKTEQLASKELLKTIMRQRREA